jgi:hypothetical protein
LHRAEVEHGGREILFAQIALPANLFNKAGDGRPVISGYLKLFDGLRWFNDPKVTALSGIDQLQRNKKPRALPGLSLSFYAAFESLSSRIL